jgi:hypothetical protein
VWETEAPNCFCCELPLLQIQGTRIAESEIEVCLGNVTSRGGERKDAELKFLPFDIDDMLLTQLPFAWSSSHESRLRYWSEKSFPRSRVVQGHLLDVFFDRKQAQCPVHSGRAGSVDETAVVSHELRLMLINNLGWRGCVRLR